MVYVINLEYFNYVYNKKSEVEYWNVCVNDKIVYFVLNIDEMCIVNCVIVEYIWYILLSIKFNVR